MHKGGIAMRVHARWQDATIRCFRKQPSLRGLHKQAWTVHKLPLFNLIFIAAGSGFETRVLDRGSVLRFLANLGTFGTVRPGRSVPPSVRRSSHQQLS